MANSARDFRPGLGFGGQLSAISTCCWCKVGVEVDDGLGL